MVRSYKLPNRVSVKIKVVYKPKASCIVLSPEDRIHFAQFCALLMTIDRQIKAKKEKALLDDAPQINVRKTIRLRKSKNSFDGQEGSQISGPLVFRKTLFLFFYCFFSFLPSRII